MDSIRIRYGVDVELPVDADDIMATQAILYVGHPGQSPVIICPAVLQNGVGTFVLTQEDTSVPLDKYKYQINVYDSEQRLQKYPDPDCDTCEEDFPDFIVAEALDINEVS